MPLRTSDAALAVKEFHEAYGLPVRDQAQPIPKEESDFRQTLISEECHEALVEMDSGESLANIGKELADILYVVYGASLHYGIPLDDVFELVHKSNMSKLWPCENEACVGGQLAVATEMAVWTDDTSSPCPDCDGVGGVVRYRADGKVLKPPSYQPPDLSALLP